MIAGCGLTGTVTVKVEPVHVPIFGVTVYVAEATMFPVFVKVPVIVVLVVPALATPPLKPVPVGVVHVYVVPAGTVPLATFVGVTVKPLPLHIVVAVIGVIAGVTFTVIVPIEETLVHGTIAPVVVTV